MSELLFVPPFGPELLQLGAQPVEVQPELAVAVRAGL